MNITKNQKITIAIVVTVVLSSLIAIFGPNAYRRLKLTNKNTLTKAKSLTTDPQVLSILNQLPGAVDKMTNEEVKIVYDVFYKYIKNNQPIPAELKTKYGEIVLKHFTF